MRHTAKEGTSTMGKGVQEGRERRARQILRHQPGNTGFPKPTNPNSVVAR